MFCAHFVIGAGPCLASGRSITLESKAAYLQAAQTSKSLLTSCARSCAGAAWPARAAAPTSGHQPSRWPPASKPSAALNKKKKISVTSQEAPNTSDNSWNFVDEVLDFNAAGLIYTGGIWTEVTHGKKSYKERGRLYRTSFSQGATEPPLPSLAKL